MDTSITVVTLTRGRTNLLKRAIASVQQQDYSGPIVHMIIVDDCAKTKDFLEGADDLPDEVVWHWMPRSSEEQSGPQRIAVLRNHAVRIAKTRWISFLDDDNEFEPNHLISLVACAMRTGYQAVHSQRKLYWPDGTPYLEPIWPWSRDVEEGKRVHQELSVKGVLQPGSNIERDRRDPWDHPDPVRIVDTGEWLLERTLIMCYPFCTEYTYEDWASVTTEDDKLLQCLVRNEVSIASTGMPTLKYYLGGYSNTFDDEQAPGSWVPEKPQSSA